MDAASLGRLGNRRASRRCLPGTGRYEGFIASARKEDRAFWIGDRGRIVNTRAAQARRGGRRSPGTGGSAILPYPRSQSIYIRDPDGHEIELTTRFGGGLE